MRTEALKEAQRRYSRKGLRVSLIINPDTDKDLYEALKSLKNKQGFIKDAVREAIKKKKAVV